MKCCKCGGGLVTKVYHRFCSTGRYEHLHFYCTCGYDWIESTVDAKERRF